MLTEIEATPSSAKNITSLAKPLAISLVALAAGAGRVPASWGSNRHLFGEIVSIPARLHIGSISAANVLAKIHVGYWISRRAAGLGTCLEDFQASKQAWVYLAQLSLNQSCSTFSAVVALVFYPRKGCLCFGSRMPRRFYSDIREQHQDLVSQWPWLPDAFTLHGLVP